MSVRQGYFVYNATAAHTHPVGGPPACPASSRDGPLRAIPPKRDKPGWRAYEEALWNGLAPPEASRVCRVLTSQKP